MSVQTQVTQALRQAIDALNLFAPAATGSLPDGKGLAMAVSAGRTETVPLSNGGTATLDVALSCKHSIQSTAMETLCQIHEALIKTAELPCGEGWQVIAVNTAAAPAYAGREGPYRLCGSALSVLYAID
jgi:hypothetical protein